MKREVPVLTITLQVQLVPGIDVTEVLDAISNAVNDAVSRIRLGEAIEAPELETTYDGELAEAGLASDEVLEPFTEETREDLLSALGYEPRD